MRRVLTWDWRNPLRIAGTTLGTSVALALVFGLASRPASSQLHWGFRTTLAWLAWVWESIFGVDAVGHVRAGGSLDVLGSTFDGSISGNAWLGAMPLTLTVITFLATAVAFRRATASCPDAVSALLLGARAAIVTTVPLVLVSLIVTVTAQDLTDLLGRSSGDGSWADTAVQQWQSLNGDRSISLGLSPIDAALIPTALLLALFAGLTILRRAWFTGQVWEGIHLSLVAPVRAIGRLAIALVLGGLLFELVVWLVRWNSHWPSGGHRPSLTAHQWVTGFASAIAYAGNAGAMALGLGSGGTVGYTASGASSAPLLSQATVHHAHGIAWFAQQDHLAAGVWIALLIAPLMLASVAWSIARAHRSDARAMLTGLTTWLVSLVLVVPALAALANVTIAGSGSADAAFGSGSFSGRAHGSISLGLSTLICTFLVFVYALLICALLVARAGSRTSARSSAADTDLLSSPR